MAKSRITKAQKERFLEEFAGGEQFGNVSACCIIAKIKRRGLYRLRERDPAFEEAFLEAEAIAADKLEAVVQTRAVVGWDVKTVRTVTRRITEEGEVGTDENGKAFPLKPGDMVEVERVETYERKVDNMLLMRLLEARKPKEFSRRATLDASEGLQDTMSTIAEVMSAAREPDETPSRPNQSG